MCTLLGAVCKNGIHLDCAMQLRGERQLAPPGTELRLFEAALRQSSVLTEFIYAFMECFVDALVVEVGDALLTYDGQGLVLDGWVKGAKRLRLEDGVRLGPVALGVLRMKGFLLWPPEICSSESGPAFRAFLGPKLRQMKKRAMALVCRERGVSTRKSPQSLSSVGVQEPQRVLDRYRVPSFHFCATV